MQRLLKDPGLPEQYRTPAGWPEIMRREWGDDEGASFARRHSEEVVAEIRKVRAALDEFKPDFVLIWGDDQHENFHDDIIPSFCVLAYDSVDVKPWSKPGAPPNRWGETADTTFHIRGHKQAAKYLASALIEQNFDLAYAYRPLHVPLGSRLHQFRTVSGLGPARLRLSGRALRHQLLWTEGHRSAAATWRASPIPFRKRISTRPRRRPRAASTSAPPARGRWRESMAGGAARLIELVACLH